MTRKNAERSNGNAGDETSVKAGIRLDGHLAAEAILVIDSLKHVYGLPRPRKALEPLDELILTILSQATSDINSGRAFENLKSRFLSWDHVRRARTTSIEAAIRSGGLAHQKSVTIKSTLGEIYSRLGSLDLSFLKTAPLDEAREFLGSLKGIGPKTVACTLLFACNRPVFPVDVHVSRVGKRLGLIPRRCSDKEAHRVMEDLIPENRYFEAHINFIRHGRTICRPSNPLCEKCCLVEYCQYYRTGGEGW